MPAGLATALHGCLQLCHPGLDSLQRCDYLPVDSGCSSLVADVPPHAQVLSSPHDDDRTPNPPKLKLRAGLSTGQARLSTKQAPLTTAGRAAGWAASRALLSRPKQHPAASSHGAEEARVVLGTHHAPDMNATGRKITGHPASVEGLHFRQEEIEAGSGIRGQPLSSKEELLHAGGNAVVEASSITAGSASYAHGLTVLRVLPASCTVRHLCHRHMHWHCSPCCPQVACASCPCCCRSPPYTRLPT